MFFTTLYLLLVGFPFLPLRLISGRAILLQRQGRFPVHLSNGTFDFESFDRHLKVLVTKYARGSASFTSTSDALHPSRREVGHGILEYEADGMMWKVEIHIGAQHLSVELDTSSPDCFIESSAYNPFESETAFDWTQMFSNVNVHSTEVSGTVWMDTFQVADLTIPGVSFGLADGEFMPRNHHADGVCGLAMSELSAINHRGLFTTMINDESLDNPLFGMALSRHGNSEITFGAVNPALFEDLTFVPVVDALGFWQIPALLVGLRGTVQMSLILDSTSQSIVMHPELALLTFRILGVRPLREFDGIENRIWGIYPCSQPPVVNFKFRDRVISLRPEDIYLGHFDTDADECILAIVGEPYGMMGVITGHPLFLSAYLAFNGHTREVAVGVRTRDTD
ncbi:hypothetical protein V8E36_001628 [Tilletia maclaganii]